MPEGRILVPADVAGGNPVRTFTVSTTAADETVASAKDQQAMVMCDPVSGAPAKVDAAGSLMVRLASTGTSAITSVAAAVAAATLLAANANRASAIVFNDSTATMYLALGAGASTTAYTVQVPAGGYYELPTASVVYTGVITAVWSTASGNARVTEFVI